MESKWYEHFFQGLAVELWSKIVTAEQTHDEVDFIVEALALGEHVRILDVACGDGRHSIELARRGYHVTGVDLSETFLEESRRKANAAGVAVDWIKSDMSQLGRVAGGTEYDGAFCFGNSFGYADYEDTRAFLDGLSGCLKAGARFVLDTGLAAESLLPNLQNRRWHKVDDIFMLSEAEYDSSSSRLQTQYTFLRGPAVQTGIATYFVYTIAELKRLFAESGLVVEQLYGTMKRDPYRFGNPRFLLAATLYKESS